jgi:hypothetical protein
MFLVHIKLTDFYFRISVDSRNFTWVEYLQVLLMVEYEEMKVGWPVMA